MEVNSLPTFFLVHPPTLQDMTTALLHAHRCMLKDEPVPVPVPLNTIPDMIVPSHIIVPRCSGETQAEYKHFGHDGVQNLESFHF